MRPAIIIFDMDDVLCRYDLGRRLRALSRLTGQTPRDIRAAVWDSGFEDAADTGAYPDPDDYLAEFGRRAGRPLTRQEWIAARREAMTPWPDMLDLARVLGRQTRLALFTNNGPLTRAELGSLFPEVTEIFVERHFSCDLGIKKPDPASFRMVADRLGVAPGHCWFIDDKKSNVTGARMAGMSAHLFRTHAALVSEARTLGLDT